MPILRESTKAKCLKEICLFDYINETAMYANILKLILFIAKFQNNILFHHRERFEKVIKLVIVFEFSK